MGFFVKVKSGFIIGEFRVHNSSKKDDGVWWAQLRPTTMRSKKMQFGSHNAATDESKKGKETCHEMATHNNKPSLKFTRSYLT